MPLYLADDDYDRLVAELVSLPIDAFTGRVDVDAVKQILAERGDVMPRRTLPAGLVIGDGAAYGEFWP